MGILMFTARVHDLIYQRSNVEYRLIKLTKKLRDLQQYAATIASGGISIGEMLNTPGSMMGRTMNYLSFAHNSSLQYMQQNAPYMQQMYMQQMQGQQQNAQQQQQYQAFIMRRNNWPPSILHHELKMLEVLSEAPVANAMGAVKISTPTMMYRSAASNRSLM